MIYEEFVELLEPDRVGYSAGKFHCPAHKDDTESLSVRDGEDKILVYCHAGCTIESICDALGINVRDLFYEESYMGNHSEIPEAEYYYTDERGELLYIKIRYPGKKFLYRNPKGWGLGESRRVLYKLPEVIKAVITGQEVWIVEGEKDVENLRRVGVTATTSGGVNDWRADYPRYFSGGKVVIVADSDVAGRESAERIARTLFGIAERVRIVEARTGNDISDHLNAGHSLEEVIECKVMTKDAWIGFLTNSTRQSRTLQASQA